MPETKLKLNDPGTIHLMALDTTSLLLPFGRPITEYLRGEALPDGAVELVSLRPADFPPEALWNHSIAALLRTTGFGSLERSGMAEIPPPAPRLAETAPVVESPSPSAADVPKSTAADIPKTRAAAAVEPAAAAPAKPGPGAAPRKPAPPQLKPPAQVKPIALVSPPPKPVIPPSMPRTTISQPPPPASALAAARAPQITQKPLPRPERPSPAPVAAKAPIPISAGKAGVRAAAAEPASKPEPPPAPAPAPVAIEPVLSLSAAPAGMLERIPIYVKIAIALTLAAGVYFAIEPPSSKTANKTPAGVTKSIDTGEQGWFSEAASDSAGSRRGRQLKLYRPSVELSDYRFQFTGRIETKALGWVFRAADTRNYYGAKLVLTGPGSLTLTRFAVVEGRESSVIEKPLAVIPGGSYLVRLDAAGPRFTISVNNQALDSWTDNRLKSGAVGFLNERDERGEASAVNLSFPRSMK